MKNTKLRLNEKIGLTGATLSLVCLIGVFSGYRILLVPQFLFLFAEIIFLSIWGLTTFNDKYEKH